MVGKLRRNYLDRHIPVDDWLEGPEHYPGMPAAQVFPNLVSTNRSLDRSNGCLLVLLSADDLPVILTRMSREL